MRLRLSQEARFNMLSHVRHSHAWLLLTMPLFQVSTFVERQERLSLEIDKLAHSLEETEGRLKRAGAEGKVRLLLGQCCEERSLCAYIGRIEGNALLAIAAPHACPRRYRMRTSQCPAECTAECTAETAVPRAWSWLQPESFYRIFSLYCAS
jgi:hypothetical protein